MSTDLGYLRFPKHLLNQIESFHERIAQTPGSTPYVSLAATKPDVFTRTTANTQHATKPSYQYNSGVSGAARTYYEMKRLFSLNGFLKLISGGRMEIPLSLRLFATKVLKWHWVDRNPEVDLYKTA